MIGVPTEQELLSSIGFSESEILQDYKIAYTSRQASLIGRREVLSGRAKFGIFGGGKELAQLALAHAFRKGDWRSGYYRDQTFMLALGETTIEEFFAQLYAHADVVAEPQSAGRQMNSHYATRILDEQGRWKDQTNMYNTSADLSPTGSQMPRLTGLAYASVLYRQLPSLQHLTNFSQQGDEVAFATIGNASCAEGMFWETVNAIGVLRAPAVITIYDDEYGISVPNEFQHTKESLTDMLAGFQRGPDDDAGYDIYTVKGWDYQALTRAFQDAAYHARHDHIPAIIHIVEMTQPQGHSTSGSHERYKSAERLQWERNHDCLTRMRRWIVDEEIASDSQLKLIEQEVQETVMQDKDRAWQATNAPILADAKVVQGLINNIAAHSQHRDQLERMAHKLVTARRPARHSTLETVREALLLTQKESIATKQALIAWRDQTRPAYYRLYGSHLWSESAEATHSVPSNPPAYSDGSPLVSGFQVLQAAFDNILDRNPEVIAFGEDLGNIGGVNQGMAGLQKKYGALRVSDVGIRETTIMGQAIGMALRGLRPIAEIQYLDYLLYAIQILSDDLATTHWRTAGGQKAPVIIRTRGHRLEGIWHAGSPMAGIIHLLRGIHVLVPRDMVRAAGFYNTLLRGDEPGLVVEVLNGYRLKETMPDNIADITIPIGVPETLRVGDDVTIVTYGACCRVAMEAAELLERCGVSAEIIDIQSLLPFDTEHHILESLKKTSRIVFLDEDVPGGATAYMLQEVLEKQGGYHWLDSEPITITAQPHRPAYGADGNYFSKPNADDVFEAVYDLMNEADPASYPYFYR